MFTFRAAICTKLVLLSLLFSDLCRASNVTKATFTYTISGSIYSLTLPPSSTLTDETIQAVSPTPTLTSPSSAEFASAKSSDGVLLVPIAFGGSTFINTIPLSEYNPVLVPSMTALVVATAVTGSTGISPAPLVLQTDASASSGSGSVSVTPSTPVSQTGLTTFDTSDSIPTASSTILSTFQSNPTSELSSTTGMGIISSSHSGSASIDTSSETSTATVASGGSTQSSIASSSESQATTTSTAPTSSALETSTSTSSESLPSTVPSSSATTPPQSSTPTPMTSNPHPSTLATATASPSQSQPSSIGMAQNTDAPPSNGNSGAERTPGRIGGDLGSWAFACLVSAVWFLP